MMEKTLNSIESRDPNSNTVEDNEWSRLMKARFKEGYVEGKCQGEEFTIQSGFDRGYVRGFGISYPLSFLKGLLVVNQIKQKNSNPETAERFKETKQLLIAFEQKWMSFRQNEIADKDFEYVKDQVFQLIKECNEPRVFQELATRFEKCNISVTQNSFVPDDEIQNSSEPSSTADLSD